MKLDMRLAALVMLAVLFSAVFCCTSAAQGPPIVVRREMRHDVSPPLRDLMKNAPPVPQIQEEAEPVKLIPLRSGFKPAPVPDQVLQRRFAAAATSAVPTPLAL